MLATQNTGQGETLLDEVGAMVDAGSASAPWKVGVIFFILYMMVVIFLSAENPSGYLGLRSVVGGALMCLDQGFTGLGQQSTSRCTA